MVETKTASEREGTVSGSNVMQKSLFVYTNEEEQTLTGGKETQAQQRSDSAICVPAKSPPATSDSNRLATIYHAVLAAADRAVQRYEGLAYRQELDFVGAPFPVVVGATLIVKTGQVAAFATDATGAVLSVGGRVTKRAFGGAGRVVYAGARGVGRVAYAGGRGAKQGAMLSGRIAKKSVRVCHGAAKVAVRTVRVTVNKVIPAVYRAGRLVARTAVQGVYYGVGATVAGARMLLSGSALLLSVSRRAVLAVLAVLVGTGQQAVAIAVQAGQYTVFFVQGAAHHTYRSPAYVAQTYRGAVRGIQGASRGAADTGRRLADGVRDSPAAAGRMVQAAGQSVRRTARGEFMTAAMQVESMQPGRALPPFVFAANLLLEAGRMGPLEVLRQSYRAVAVTAAGAVEVLLPAKEFEDAATLEERGEGRGEGDEEEGPSLLGVAGEAAARSVRLAQRTVAGLQGGASGEGSEVGAEGGGAEAEVDGGGALQVVAESAETLRTEEEKEEEKGGDGAEEAEQSQDGAEESAGTGGDGEGERAGAGGWEVLPSSGAEWKVCESGEDGGGIAKVDNGGQLGEGGAGEAE